LLTLLSDLQMHLGKPQRTPVAKLPIICLSHVVQQRFPVGRNLSLRTGSWLSLGVPARPW